jgi:glycosyltransferase involved in cell wall biosynthesis
MRGGGAERVVSTLSNHLSKIGFDISILVVRGNSIYTLSDSIRLFPLYNESEIKSNVINKLIRRLDYLPKIIKLIKSIKPDILITVHGGGWNGLMVISAKILGIKVIAAEHISWTVGSHQWGRRFERKVVYLLADAVAVLTDADREYYAHYLPRVVKIPNPLSFNLLTEPSVREKTILAVGRLDSWKHKGFDTLLEVFSRFHTEFPDWRLQIAGTGAAGRDYLGRMARDLKVDQRVDFLGFRSDIADVMKSSSIFVLSSRFEGFGMVLIEAMSQGCACISFDCPSGPADILQPDVDGFLVPDQDKAAMVEGLVHLIQNEQLRTSLGQAAVAKANQYRVEVIGGQWVSLFKSIGLPA